MNDSVTAGSSNLSISATTATGSTTVTWSETGSAATTNNRTELATISSTICAAGYVIFCTISS